MRRTALVLLAAGLTVAVAACSGPGSRGDKPAVGAAAVTWGATGAGESPAAPSAVATKTAAAPGPLSGSASATFAVVAMTVQSAKFGRSVTAEDDPNHLLGRPGQYTSKVTFTDSRVKEADVEGEDADSVARGGAVEVFATEADAKARAQYIQGIVKSLPAVAEYDFVHGTVLIRVSKLLTPEQADGFKGAIGA
ncbi:hypothetical protein AB0E96_10865 [Kitasatospora sp. NPDC036755]|uniref:hypothetical protein n=1 Tax=Kitasatospora sp. NPDC036755 TaxID=3154600 RepID=UPI0033F9FF63